MSTETPEQMLSPENWASIEFLRNHSIEYAKHTFEVSGCIRPMCVLHTRLNPDGEKMPCVIGVVPKDFDTVEAKDVFAETIRSVAEKTQALAAVLFTEAWMVAGIKESELSCQVSEHPDRMEVVMISIESEKERISVILPIDRTGEKPKLLDPSIEDFTRAEGRFNRLLPKYNLEKN